MIATTRLFPLFFTFREISLRGMLRALAGSASNNSALSTGSAFKFISFIYSVNYGIHTNYVLRRFRCKSQTLSWKKVIRLSLTLLLNIGLAIFLNPVGAARAIHSPTYRHIPRREIARNRLIFNKSIRDLSVPPTKKVKYGWGVCVCSVRNSKYF